MEASRIPLTESMVQHASSEEIRLQELKMFQPNKETSKSIPYHFVSNTLDEIESISDLQRSVNVLVGNDIAIYTLNHLFSGDNALYELKSRVMVEKCFFLHVLASCNDDAFCGHCTKQLPSKLGNRCAQCQAFAYCNSNCQASHWRSGHRTFCKLIKKRRDERARRHPEMNVHIKEFANDLKCVDTDILEQSKAQRGVSEMLAIMNGSPLIWLSISHAANIIMRSGAATAFVPHPSVFQICVRLAFALCKPTTPLTGRKDWSAVLACWFHVNTMPPSQGLHQNARLITGCPASLNCLLDHIHDSPRQSFEVGLVPAVHLCYNWKTFMEDCLKKNDQASENMTNQVFEGLPLELHTSTLEFLSMRDIFNFSRCCRGAAAVVCHKVSARCKLTCKAKKPLVAKIILDDLLARKDVFLKLNGASTTEDAEKVHFAARSLSSAIVDAHAEATRRLAQQCCELRTMLVLVKRGGTLCPFVVLAVLRACEWIWVFRKDWSGPMEGLEKLCSEPANLYNPWELV
jgi:hypothetical protein